MRGAARIAGMLWMATVAMAGIILLASGRFPNVRGVMYALMGAALPGIFLFRWGNTRTPHAKSLPNPQAPKAPFDRAAEAGHVMRVEAEPHA
jgi:hypothetical protein